MRIKIFLVSLLVLAQSFVKADEGMWLPMFIKRLNYADMKKHGLKLSAEEIYSVNKSSLKDAIVRLGGGFCTAEMISPEGLVLTNHHCAYDLIQSHSSVKNDYLTDGFWAMTRAEELPNEGLTASFLVRMEDVTTQALTGITPQMTESERNSAIQKNMAEIKAKAEEGNDYEAVVKNFFDGNEYYMFIYETYKDVRLVGAPPSSIGKFGGETDNWMWPRHTGDFSLLRIYTGKNGKPAEFAADNIPLQPKHFLPVSLKGVKEGDFSMVMGYPGSTDRYLTSRGVQLAVTVEQPERVKIREKKLALIKEDMDADPDIRIKYASKWAQVSNYWKYFKGQSEMLTERDVYSKKKKIEDQLEAWIKADPERMKKFSTVIEDFNKSYDEKEKYTLSQVYLQEAFFGSEAMLFSLQMNGLFKALLSSIENPEATEQVKASIREEGEDYFKDYNMPTDKKVTTAMFDMYMKNVPASQHPSLFDTIRTKYNGDISKFINEAYQASIFTDKARFMAFLDNPSEDALNTDPVFSSAMGVYSDYQKNVSANTRAANETMSRAERLFMEALMEMQPDRTFYPNANSTMRLSFGEIGSYEPLDGVKYKYYTTLEGVMEKEDPNNPEFIVPAKLKELYNNKDYGQYADKDGKLHVGFISDNDITGGNSGSPVIDAKGNLIGLAFDGNWEAMSGDIFFEPELQRTISADIRYVLFIIDKFAGAGHLVNEMKLVK